MCESTTTTTILQFKSVLYYNMNISNIVVHYSCIVLHCIVLCCLQMSLAAFGRDVIRTVALYLIYE